MKQMTVIKATPELIELLQQFNESRYTNEYDYRFSQDYAKRVIITPDLLCVTPEIELEEYTDIKFSTYGAEVKKNILTRQPIDNRKSMKFYTIKIIDEQQIMPYEEFIVPQSHIVVLEIDDKMNEQKVLDMIQTKIETQKAALPQPKVVYRNGSPQRCSSNGDDNFIEGMIVGGLFF